MDHSILLLFLSKDVHICKPRPYSRKPVIHPCRKNAQLSPANPVDYLNESWYS